VNLGRREVFKLFAFAGSPTCLLPRSASAATAPRTLVLNNGFRAHLIPSACGYVSLALILRSQEIVHQHGLAHLMEHTSFVGAAGDLSARAVTDAQKNYLQESNASTALGVLRWDLTFLPRYLSQALSLLSNITLDQKFDTHTVAREAKVVLEELYLDKFKANMRQQQAFEEALYGRTHPHVRRTLDSEIATARLPAETLAAQLRSYAARLRLPANMDLFMVGQFEPDQVALQIDQCFGKYPYARGPYLAMPTPGVTRAYHALAGVTHELRHPLSQLLIGWNTGVRAKDPDAGALVTLCDCLNEVLFKQLREQQADSYAPEVEYRPDGYSGIISMALPSSKHPATLEKRALECIQTLKMDLDAEEFARLHDRAELRRRKLASSPEAQVDVMVRKAIDGAVIDEMPDTIKRDELIAVARKYLPSHKGGYVRLALTGHS
jgi:predicted Zn-dependent peptidase